MGIGHGKGFSSLDKWSGAAGEPPAPAAAAGMDAGHGGEGCELLQKTLSRGHRGQKHVEGKSLSSESPSVCSQLPRA